MNEKIIMFELQINFSAFSRIDSRHNEYADITNDRFAE